MANKQFNAVDGYTVGNATVVSVIDANANVTGNAITATANITTPQFISNIAIGTAPLVVTSTTVVANLNANALQGSTPATANTASTIALRDASGNLSANFFIGNGSQLTGIVASAGASIVNGTSNVVVDASGNVRTSVAGTANVLVVTATSANITGDANVSGNLSAGNITTGAGSGGNITGANVISANTFTGNITSNTITLTGTANGNANVATISANLGLRTIASTYTDNVAAAGTVANAAIHAIATPTLTASNAITTTNLSTFYIQSAPTASTNVTATNSYALFVAAGNAFFGGNVIGNIASGNSNVRIAANSNVVVSVAGNSNILTITGTGVNVFGTFSTGTGNANIGNIGTAQVLASANITAPQLISNIAIGTAPLVVTSTTVVANLNANALQGSTPATANTASTIALRDTNGNLSANFFIGNGSQLTGIGSAGSIANGTSNVNIPAVNGNVNTSVGGTANVLVVTATGANITGTANISGNLSAGNITTGAGSGGNISGANVITANTFTGVFANGNSNVNIPAANGNVNISAVGVANILVVTGTGVNVAGTFNTGAGNANIGNIGTAQVLASANITAPQLISNVAGGTAPLIVTSTTVVANLNANALQGSTPATANTASTIALRDTNGNLSANFFIGNGSQLTGIVASGGASISNGNSNVNIPAANGNVTITAVGNANIVVITGTGVNVFGTFNTGAGNANIGNIGTAQVLATANITAPQVIANIAQGTTPFLVNSNTVVANLNASLLLGATTATANTASTIALRDTNGNLSANFFIGNGSQLTGITASGGSNISNGTSNVSIATSGGNVTTSVGGTANVLVITTTGANILGTLNTGTGNANVGNLGTAQVLATANITAPQVIANIATGTAPFLVNSNTVVANLNASLLLGATSATANTASTIALRDANGNISANFFIGNGSQLTGVVATAGSIIANGTSNVSIPAVDGNVTISVAGNANIFTVTGTGANIFGTANVSNGLFVRGQGSTFTATSAPTADMVTITNAGQPVVTTGISALQVNYVAGNAAVEASAARFDITPGGNGSATWNGLRIVSAGAAVAGETLNAIKVDNKTAGAGTSTVLYAGTGYDNIINYNGTTVIYGNGVVNGGQIGNLATANSVVIGAGASAPPTSVAPGTTGNVLTSNGTNWVSQASGATGGGVTTGQVVAQVLGMAMP